VPLHGDLDHNAFRLRGKVADRLVQAVLVGIQMLHKSANAAFILEHLVALSSLLDQAYAHARIEKGQLAQTFCQHLVAEFYIGENTGTGMKMDHRTRLLRIARGLQGSQRLPHAVALLVDLVVATDRHVQAIGQRIDDGYTDTVQTAGNIVGVGIELATGMQHRHDDLGCRAPLFFMQIHRYTTTIVRYGDALIAVNGHLYLPAVSGQRLVDG